jgi:ABC-type dipeptide/oligopeptide/nickel transport system permease component
MSREARPWLVVTLVMLVLAALAWFQSRRWLEDDEVMTAIAGAVLTWVAGLLALAAAVAAYITVQLRNDPD